MPKEIIDSKDNIAIALTASVVAREALEFTNISQTPALLKLRYKALIESVERLRDQLKQALKE